MFEDAKQTFEVAIARIKKFYRIFRFVSFLVSLSYFIFAAIVGLGIRWVNIAFACLLVVYQILDYFIISKRAKKVLRRGYRWIRLLIKAISLAMIIYGIVETSQNATAFRIIFVIFMVLFWMIQVFFEIMLIIFERMRDRFVSRIKSEVNEYISTHQSEIELLSETLKKKQKDDDELEIIDVEDLKK